MLDRRTFTLDRVVAILLALALLAGGLWVLAWTLDLLPQAWPSPSDYRYGLGSSVEEATWWPWALLVGGVILAFLGLIWFGSHFRNNRIGVLTLPGDAQGGRLLMNSGALASGAAAALEESSPGIASASGRMVEEGKRLLLSLTATVKPDADLRDVVRASDEVAAQALRNSGRQDLACRVRVKVGSRGRSEPRVH